MTRLPMADPFFARAIAVVLRHEGGYAAHAADPGGATNWGISLRYARAVAGELRGAGIVLDQDGDGDLDADDIRLLPRETAVRVYRTQWWDRYGYGLLLLPIGIKVFDLAVNMGAGAAHRCLQRALRANGRAVVEDGLIGPATRAAVVGVGADAVLPTLRSEAAGHYRALIAANPKLEPFRAGWMNRAYD